MKAYSGYVTLPSTLDPSVAPYQSHVFFWFFEARNHPKSAPLTVWLQGGPGSPSIDQALGHNGPCVVNEDSNSTRLNAWSWNTHSNLLYIDQPAQTGFTYDKIIEGVLTAVDGSIDVSGAEMPLNLTAVKGKFSSQDPTMAANTTQIAARALYHFIQAWFGEFDQYRRDNISIWSQSYGGHFAPALADTIMRENNPVTSQLRKQPKKGDKSKVFKIGIDTVGVINGFFDMIIQGRTFPDFAMNNTYGIRAYSEANYTAALEAYGSKGGCRDQGQACNRIMAESDPQHFANNETVLELCGKAFELCWNQVYLPYDLYSGVSLVSHPPVIAVLRELTFCAISVTLST